MGRRGVVWALLCYGWLLSLHPGVALSPEGHILLHFKEYIENANVSNRLQLWNANDETPCGWPGVTCTNLSAVSHLSLARASLVGTLPSAIIVGFLAMESLVDLDLSWNGLYGTIPANIGLLGSLTELSLEGNYFSGPLPPLDGMSNLTKLEFGHNNLNGSIPSLLGLKALQLLDLAENRFSGDVLDLQGPAKVRHLDLSGNNFTGSQLSEVVLRNHVSVRYFAMSRTGVGGPLPSWILNMPRLQRLNLSSNNLSGEIPPAVSGGRYNSSVLATVDLAGNRLTGSIPSELLHLEGQKPLAGVNLSGNSLTGGIPDYQDATRFKLHFVDFSDNQLNGSIPSYLGLGQSETFHLLLQNNHLSGNVSSLCSGNTTLLSSVAELQLQGNQLTGGVTPEACANWKRMKILDLSRNSQLQIVNSSLQLVLETFPHLEQLRLSNLMSTCQIPKANPDWVDNSTYSLRVLDLSNSNLEGDLSFFAHAGHCFPRLTNVDLSGNKLTGRVPSNFTQIENLRVLNLSNNNLSGPLPPLPSSLLKLEFFAGNPGLCGHPLQACKSHPKLSLLAQRILVISAAVCTGVGVGILLLLARCWAVHKQGHRPEDDVQSKGMKGNQQDVDLIAVLKGKDSANLIPLSDLRKATDNFSEKFQIGAGGFGTVYKGQLKDGTTVAIKRSTINQGSPKDKQYYLNEVRILSQVHHRNLVRLLGCCLESKIALLVLEYVPNGTLQEHLRGEKLAQGSIPGLTWWQRLQIAVQTADALAYLHECADPPIIHRDVKSANVLLDEHLNAKVADFGIARLAPLGATHVSTQVIQGTFGYIDPEYYTRSQLTVKSDVFSFGVVLLELISAQSAVDLRRGDDAGIVSMAVSLLERGEFEDMIDPAVLETFYSAVGRESIVGVVNLAFQCLKTKSRDRPTMRQVWKELQALWLQYDSV